jgi:hypothetical protein
MRRVKSYHKYKFVNNYGEPSLSSVKVDLRHLKIKDIIKDGDNTTVDTSMLPLPLTSYCKVIGTIDRKEKVKRSLFKQRKHERYEKDYDVLEMLDVMNPDMVEPLIDSNVKVYPGDWCYNFNNIIDMCDDSNDRQFDVDDIIDGYFSRAGIDLVLPKIPCYSSDWIYGLGIKPKSSSGYLTSKMLFKKRKLSTRYTKPAAHFYLDWLMHYDGWVVDRSLVELGGREKRLKFKHDEYKDMKTRCIFQMEDIPTLISQSFAKPINESLQKISEGFNYGGRVNGAGAYRKFIEDMECQEGFINFNCDFSGHDNRVKRNAVVAAMSMLRLCYPEGIEIDRAFIYLTSSVLYKRVVLPESGFIYEICKGLATGHGFTSILTTMCSYGTLSTAINKVGGIELAKNTVLRMAGDDVCGKLPINVVDSVNQIIQKESGHIMDDISSNSGYFRSGSPITRRTFLKKKYNNHFSWNNFELYINLFNPSMKETSYGRVIDNLKQMMYQAPYDESLNNELKTLIVIKLLSEMDKSDITYSDVKIFSEGSISNKWRYINYIRNNIKVPQCPSGYIDNVGLVNSTAFHPFISEYMPINVKARVKQVLADINDQLRKKYYWFNKTVVYKAHKTILRLAVFDMGKLVTNPVCRFTMQGILILGRMRC